MFAQIIVAILLGVTAGTFTGLIPGIHINLISTMLLAMSVSLLEITTPFILAIFILSMSVTHTFLDAIPSIFLGAPDSAQALGVLPGHRFLLKGKGLFALKLTVIGSYGATLLSILFFPLFLWVVKYLYPIVDPYIKYFIVLVVLFMIFRDRKKLWATVVFITSGALGFLVLNTHGISNPLFPLLSGMFGVSTLLYSLKDTNNLPVQTESDDKVSYFTMSKALFSGCFSGFLTAVTPGLGAGMASVISSQITKKLGDAGFMILVGSISTFNFILSIVTYYILNKARNGSIIAVQQLIDKVSLNEVIIILIVILFVGSFAVFLSINLGRLFLKVINKVNYKKLVMSIIAFIFFLTIILSNFIGIVILLTSTAIGMIPAVKKTTRTLGMGCLIVPVLSYFFF
jgi:putative membrane protein